MKKHHKPCICETCEKARFLSPCKGCSDVHSSFWRTVTMSPEWKLWEEEISKRMRKGKVIKGIFKSYGKIWDIAESRECGCISKEHFADFIKFVKKMK